jgi:hypothetical protein
MNYKIQTLLQEGVSISTLENLTSEQLNVLYERAKKSKKKETKEETTKNISVTTYNNAAEVKGKTLKNATFNDDGTITSTNEGEVTEKAVSKKQRGLMGAAYSVEKGEKELKNIPKSYRKKVEGLTKSMNKKQLKDFATTKEDGLPEKKEMVKNLEESIMKLIENNLPPTTTKSELLNSIKKFKR